MESKTETRWYITVTYHHPPDGKIESHYIGEFSKGEQHGKGKKYNEDGKPKWKKVEYINGKIKNEKK